MSGLIQVSPRPAPVPGAAQAAMVAGKSVSTDTRNASDSAVRSNRRGTWKVSSGKIPRSSGSSQNRSSAARVSAIGKNPA